MTKLKTGAGLGAAILLAFATSHAIGQTAAPPAPPWAAAKTDITLADHRDHVLRLIQTGRLQGWLDRDEARAAYRSLRRLRLREGELRTASGGELTAADRDELVRAFDELAQELRWTRKHNSQGRYRPH